MLDAGKKKTRKRDETRPDQTRPDETSGEEMKGKVTEMRRETKRNAPIRGR